MAQAAHRTPLGSFALCESETTATMFYLCESATTATTKRPAGTGINPSFCQRAILYLIENLYTIDIKVSFTIGYTEER
ncbi:hypothetical protein [Lysinibacillus sphaericus]|uniref:hypothetical protein n=1 Tax=Lysinibacillus sphaericus TaxID=1421 RepID=UPI001CC08F3A|nr:hypothetical protein [Lysinibacillus sphaericus]